MNKPTNWENIQEAGTYANLPVGIYVCVVKDVKDVVDKEYLEVQFDIAEGQYKDYFAVLYQTTQKQRGLTYRSYKEKGLPFFKAFITAIEKSNQNYKWDWNERSLIGKKVVICFREEEYLTEDAKEIRVRVKADEFHSLEKYNAGELKVKPKKELTPDDKIKYADANKPTLDTPIDDLDAPF